MSFKTKWTLVNCKASAGRFTSRSEWQSKSPNSYMAAYRNGWLDICCAGMDIKKNPVITFEECQKMAIMAGDKRTWFDIDHRTYKKAQSKYWIEACLNGQEEPVPKNQFKDVRDYPYGHRRYYKWTFENCQKSARLYRCRYYWQRSEPGAYQAARRNGWLDKIEF